MPAIIDPGRYIVVHTGGFVPAVIRWGTHSRVDHAVMVVGDGTIVEAEAGGVIVSPQSKYRGCYARANLAEHLAPGQLDAAARKARALVDTPYNFCAIGDDAFEDVLGWHIRWLMRLSGGDHDLDCSQLVAVCGNAAGADWRAGKQPCQVTPGDLDRRAGMVRVRL